MRRLHRWKVRQRPAHPVPALLGVAKTANRRRRLVLDDAEFVAWPMHQNNP
jgi:hypothetical protein